MKLLRVLWVIISLHLLSGCSLSSQDKLDAFYAHRPKSILVTPVLNETPDLMASPVFISTITRPLAERGYYVFPIYLTDYIFRDLGLVEAGHIHQLPTQRFFDLFGADAVLFITIKDWSTKYLLLASFVKVEMEYVLKDTKTGIVLWEDKQSFQQSSTIGDPLTLVISAAINALTTDYLPLARAVNLKVFSPPQGIPAGPYHSAFMQDHDAF